MIVDTRRTKVHRITLLVVDHDVLGSAGCASAIENARYPNRCISPRAVSVDTVEVDWHDQHPLNLWREWRAEFARLFPATTGRDTGKSRPHPEAVTAARDWIAHPEDMTDGHLVADILAQEIVLLADGRSQVAPQTTLPPWNEPGHMCSPMGGDGPPCDRCKAYYKAGRAILGGLEDMRARVRDLLDCEAGFVVDDVIEAVTGQEIKSK